MPIAQLGKAVPTHRTGLVATPQYYREVPIQRCKVLQLSLQIPPRARGKFAPPFVGLPIANASHQELPPQRFRQGGNCQRLGRISPKVRRGDNGDKKVQNSLAQAKLCLQRTRRVGVSIVRERLAVSSTIACSVQWEAVRTKPFPILLDDGDVG